MNTKPQTVLITGASGGIGYELAKLFARDRHNLVPVARNAERLSEVATELNHFGITVKTVPLDLAAPPAPTFLFDQLKRENIPVDILINNAGFGVFGEFGAMAEEEILGQIQLNITALTHLTRLFLAPMLTRRRGKVMKGEYTAAVSPGPADGRVLRDQSLCAFVLRSTGKRAPRIGSYYDLLLPRSDQHRLRQTCWQREIQAVQEDRRHES